jgi:hypothetical protein
MKTTLVALFASSLVLGSAACAAPVSDASSSDSAVSAGVHDTAVEGTLTRLAAIGGETTGFGLETANGKTIELDLKTNGFDFEFVENAKVKVVGHYTTVFGVEIPSRKVLVVTELTVKPGPAIVTDAATRVVVQNHGGGFTPPPPPGSTCAIDSSKFDLDLASHELSWTICTAPDFKTPLANVKGSKVLTDKELATVKPALAKLHVSFSTLCGADKPFVTASVTTDKGTTEYIDSFYGCNEPEKPHADGIDEVIGALSELAK